MEPAGPDRPSYVIPPAWPLLVAVGVVIVLAIGSIVLDVIVARQTADRTSMLVDNALRSVRLADDLRAQARTLVAGPLDRGVARAVSERIAYDAMNYEPLATFSGERAAWTHLQGALAQLQRHPAAHLLPEVEDTLDRIVAINREGARDNVDKIQTLHRDEIAIEFVAAAITSLLAIGVAVALRRMLRHRRALLAAHLAMIAERQRELEAFAGRVAHDLRGPLMPIRGYADLLVMDEGTSPVELGRRIARNAGQMVDLIDALLALSVSGEPGTGTADVAPVVDEVLADLRSELGDASVELAVAGCTVACAPAVLAEILRNLVANASKYREPSRRLELGVSASPRDGTVELVVTDNGRGMDAETATRAFDPFFRASSSRAIEGHGLGLSIVKRTVEALGGTCTLRSTPDVGTRIAIRLPAASARDPR